jgi:hypothetical protein
VLKDTRLRSTRGLWCCSSVDAGRRGRGRLSERCRGAATEANGSPWLLLLGLDLCTAPSQLTGSKAPVPAKDASRLPTEERLASWPPACPGSTGPGNIGAQPGAEAAGAQRAAAPRIALCPVAMLWLCGFVPNESAIDSSPRAGLPLSSAQSSRRPQQQPCASPEGQNAVGTRERCRSPRLPAGTRTPRDSSCHHSAHWRWPRR